MLNSSNKAVLNYFSILKFNLELISSGGSITEYRGVVKSELKQKILLSLLKQSSKLSEMKVNLHSSKTTISHALKELEQLSLTKKSSGVYSLTPLGVMEAQISGEYYRATETLEKFREFWLAHDVSSIPPALMGRLGLLSESNLVKTASSELGKVHENFIQMVVESKQVRGLSPIFHPDYVGAFKRILSRGGSVELVLTDRVLSKTLENAESSGAGELFKGFLRDGQLKIFLVDDLKIALTVTESLFSMGLFYPSGEYDYNTDLVSLHTNALQWGGEIFWEYLKQSKKVER